MQRPVEEEIEVVLFSCLVDRGVMVAVAVVVVVVYHLI